MTSQESAMEEDKKTEISHQKYDAIGQTDKMICKECQRPLKLVPVNFKEGIYVCYSDQCLFPLEEKDIDQYMVALENIEK